MTRGIRVAIGFAVGLGLVGCGGASSPSTEPAVPAGAEQRVVYEKMPDGSVKKTTITTTHRTVPAPAPPPRPADPYPSDPLVRYNVERVNAYRAKKSLPPYLYDQKISDFAMRGSQQLAADHRPHAHFAANAKGAPGFGSRSAENQGDPNGVPQLVGDQRSAADRIKNGQKQIDVMLELMFAEGPGGGHYDNMMDPTLRRIGVGLFWSPSPDGSAAARLYLTNDISN